METKKYLGARIREIRQRCKLKQSELAELVDIDSKHMSKIECGRCYPSFDLLDKIAGAMQVNTADFLDIEHLRGKDELLKELQELLNKSDEDQIRKMFKIFKEII